MAYVLEERENRSGCFVQTSASKSLDALSLISKREATKLRDEMESVLEEDESGSSAIRTSTTIERATRPGHDAWLWSRVIRSYQTPFLYNGKRRRENVVASE